MQLRESDLEEDKVTEHNAVKMTFHGRKNYDQFKTAVDRRSADIKTHLKTLLQQIEASGVNIYKQVELHDHYLPVIPVELKSNIIYAKPSREIVEALKEERAKRSAFKSELNTAKRKVVKELEMAAIG